MTRNTKEDVRIRQRMPQEIVERVAKKMGTLEMHAFGRAEMKEQ